MGKIFAIAYIIGPVSPDTLIAIGPVRWTLMGMAAEDFWGLCELLSPSSHARSLVLIPSSPCSRRRRPAIFDSASTIIILGDPTPYFDLYLGAT